ncbi:MAG: hypothetical protein Q8N23_04835 [Archangium sp.]|nr:hypothetical protein [Archangium sp.]MDP3571383.1 hypothetical protein [Archangium sp.]
MRALWLSLFVAAPALATSMTWVDGGVHVTVDSEEEAPPSFRWFDAYSPRGRDAEPAEDGSSKPSLIAPDGSKLSFTLTHSEGSWAGNAFTPNTTFRPSVKRGSVEWPVTLPLIPDRVWVWWSPDSRRALLELVTGNDSLLLLVPGAFPRVQVLYPPKAPLDADALAKVDLLAAKVGCVVAFAGEAKKERPKTVVYAEKGHEVQAKTLAGLLPGGASVEPLTWKVNASLVIAVGESFKPR